jgi:hypothetical protein
LFWVCYDFCFFLINTLRVAFSFVSQKILAVKTMHHLKGVGKLAKFVKENSAAFPEFNCSRMYEEASQHYPLLKKAKYKGGTSLFKVLYRKSLNCNSTICSNIQTGRVPRLKRISRRFMKIAANTSSSGQSA